MSSSHRPTSKRCRRKSKAVNPHLAFLPLMYFTEMHAEVHPRIPRPVIDGVVVAYLQDREEIERTWAMLNDAAIPPMSALTYPADTPSRAGEYVHGQPIGQGVARRPLRALSFVERDGFTGPTAGYHYKQLFMTEPWCGKRTWLAVPAVGIRLRSMSPGRSAGRTTLPWHFGFWKRRASAISRSNGESPSCTGRTCNGRPI